MRFPTMWHVRLAKPQISLCICAVWSELLLVAWIFCDCKATDWTPFGVSKLKRMLHRLVGVYTCQYATLLEISYRGSINITGSATIIPATVGVVLLLLVVGFLGWLYYASTHPVSASGKWLLEVSILLKYNIQWKWHLNKPRVLSLLKWKVHIHKPKVLSLLIWKVHLHKQRVLSLLKWKVHIHKPKVLSLLIWKVHLHKQRVLSLLIWKVHLHKPRVLSPLRPLRTKSTSFLTRKPMVLSPLRSLRVRNEVNFIPLANA